MQMICIKYRTKLVLFGVMDVTDVDFTRLNMGLNQSYMTLNGDRI